jgi:hypothetical protein
LIYFKLQLGPLSLTDSRDSMTVACVTNFASELDFELGTGKHWSCLFLRGRLDFKRRKDGKLWNSVG